MIWCLSVTMTLWLYNVFLIAGNQRNDAGALRRGPPERPLPLFRRAGNTAVYVCVCVWDAAAVTLIQHLLLCYHDYIAKTTGYPCLHHTVQTVFRLLSFLSNSDISGRMSYFPFQKPTWKKKTLYIYKRKIYKTLDFTSHFTCTVQYASMEVTCVTDACTNC